MFDLSKLNNSLTLHFDDPPKKGEIREMLNSILRRHETEFSFSEKFVTISSSTPVILPLMYGVWDNTHKTITLPDGYVEIISVVYDNVQLREVPFVDLQGNVGYYCIMDSVLYFHKDFEYEVGALQLHIILNEDYINATDEVLVPASMFEMLKAEIIVELCVRTKYKDSDLFAYYSGIYQSERRKMLKRFGIKTRDFRVDFGAVVS